MARYTCTVRNPAQEGHLTPLMLKRLQQQLIEKHREDTKKTRRELAAQLLRIRSHLNERRKRFRDEISHIIKQQIHLLTPKIEKQLGEELEQECLGLVFELVRRFLEKTLPKDKRYLTKMVSTAIAQLREKRQVTLQVHPQDESTVQDFLQDSEQEEFVVECSEKLSPGKAMLCTPDGSIHIDWECEYERVTRKIIATYTRQRGEHGA